MKLIRRVEIDENSFPGTKHKLRESIKVGEIGLIEEKYITTRPANFEVIVTAKEFDVGTVWIIINLLCTYVRVWVIKS